MRLRILASTMLIFALTACGGGSSDSDDGDDSSAPPLSKAEAKKALFTLADAPEGWTVDPEDSTDDGIKVTEGSKACKLLVDGKDDEAPTKVEISFSSPDESQSVDHSIESYAGDDAVKEFAKDVKGIGSCKSFTMGDGKEFSADFTLELADFKDVGDDSAAFKAYTSTGGTDVFIDSVGVRVGQNVVSITTFGVGSAIPADELESIVDDALAKLEKVA